MKKITPKQSATALYESLQERSQEAANFFDNFLAFVWANKDWKNLNKIVKSFAKIYQEQEGLADAQIVSAADLYGLN
mgnify:CR=1 FL=1